METWKQWTFVKKDHETWKTYCVYKWILAICSSVWDDHICFILLLCNIRMEDQLNKRTFLNLYLQYQCGTCLKFLWPALLMITPNNICKAETTSLSIAVCVYPYYIFSVKCGLYFVEPEYSTDHVSQRIWIIRGRLCSWVLYIYGTDQNMAILAKLYGKLSACSKF